MGIDAFPIGIQAIPEMVDGGALEDGEKEEQQPDNDCYRHGDVENGNVDAMDGDAKQGEDNRDFRNDTGEDVKDLAKEPALQN